MGVITGKCHFTVARMGEMRAVVRPLRGRGPGVCAARILLAEGIGIPRYRARQFR